MIVIRSAKTNKQIKQSPTVNMMLSNNIHTLILRNNNTYIIKRDGKLVVRNKLLRFLITKTFGSQQFLDKTVSNNVARCTILVSRESFA